MKVSEDVKKLCRILGVAPMFFCDAPNRVDPIKIGKLLERRHQYDPNGEHSLRDCVLKYYGAEAAALAEDNF